MFRNSKTFIAIAAAAIFGAGIGIANMTPSAEAQQDGSSPIILTINQAQVVATSQAGQSISTQLEALQQTANAEFQSQVDQYVAQAKSENFDSSEMTEEQFNDAARRLIAPRLREIKVRELGIAEQNALSELSQAMTPILQQIVEERGATVLIERQNVLYASQSTDITQEVLNRLNAQLQTVQVEAIDLQKEIAAAAARAQQQQQQ